jgi:hypothetical protein
MANLEKHKKNLSQEWTEAEESTMPAQSRSSHVLGAYIQIPKAVPRKGRRAFPAALAAKPDPALAREPAPRAKAEEKPSQASSPGHLRKLNRLPKLRAPFSPNPARPASGARG